MNGNWRGWLLGIVATMIAAAIGNAILFQRDTREQLATINERMKRNDERADNILKYLRERIDERIQQIERRIDKLEQR
jgi:Flp pilus assembly protein TadB